MQLVLSESAREHDKGVQDGTHVHIRLFVDRSSCLLYALDDCVSQCDVHCVPALLVCLRCPLCDLTLTAHKVGIVKPAAGGATTLVDGKVEAVVFLANRAYICNTQPITQ